MVLRNIESFPQERENIKIPEEEIEKRAKEILENMPEELKEELKKEGIENLEEWAKEKAEKQLVKEERFESGYI